jgi:hypothetical protein
MFQMCFNLMECVSILSSQHTLVFHKMRIEVLHLVGHVSQNFEMDQWCFNNEWIFTIVFQYFSDDYLSNLNDA